MATYGHAQILGFAEDVEGVLTKERTKWKKAGLDPDAILALLKAQHQVVVDLNLQQEALKAQLKDTTTAYMAERERLYIQCSGVLDSLMAAVQKTSDQAKILRRLRSRIRRPKGDDALAAPMPVEVPTAGK